MLCAGIKKDSEMKINDNNDSDNNNDNNNIILMLPNGFYSFIYNAGSENRALL